MTIRNIIKQLRKEGHRITYYVRKDGGVLIRSIDGQKFTGAAGNAVARQMTGQILSSARQAQTRFAVVAKKWKRAKLPSSAGDLTFRKFTRTIKEEGLSNAYRYLSEKEKYASGIAYSKNIDYLIDKINQYKNSLEGLGRTEEIPDLDELIEFITLNAWKIKEEWMIPIYERLYDLNHGISAKDVMENVKSIINQ